ncbi:MAG: cysteine synthase [Actinobacteria bacterium]|nr:cysteine synthase [Actinomycetota bacterium]
MVVSDLVGNTPLYEIKYFKSKSVRLFAKLEWYNPSGSVKDRAATRIFVQALKAGKLSNKVLLDATSGNTGIAYAMLGASYCVPIELALPENATAERKLMIRQFGAKIHYTSPLEGTDGAQRFVQEQLKAYPDMYYCPDQYNNEDNWKAHYYGTGPEIYRQSNGEITHFVCGVGTSGTFVGTSRFLQDHGVTCVQVQPDTPMHGLEGWKHLDTAIVPGIYDPNLAHEHMVVSTDHAFSYAKSAATHLGLMLSPSSAANLYAALQVCESIESGTVVTVFPDNAFKYLKEPFWSDDDYNIDNPFA